MPYPSFLNRMALPSRTAQPGAAVGQLRQALPAGVVQPQRRGAHQTTPGFGGMPQGRPPEGFTPPVGFAPFAGVGGVRQGPAGGAMTLNPQPVGFDQEAAKQQLLQAMQQRTLRQGPPV